MLFPYIIPVGLKAMERNTCTRAIALSRPVIVCAIILIIVSYVYEVCMPDMGSITSNLLLLLLPVIC